MAVVVLLLLVLAAAAAPTTIASLSVPTDAPLPARMDDCPASIFDHSINSKGSLKIPVFHKSHPCLLMSDRRQLETSIDVIEDVKTNDFAFLIPVLLGSPPVMNLVVIDTGATFSWVQCEPCIPRCHVQSQVAGRIYDPTKSSSFRGAKCKSPECKVIQDNLRLRFSNCMEKEDVCLYAMSFGFEWAYTAGKVVWDTLMFGKDSGITTMQFLFGCSQDVKYTYTDAGIFGFGTTPYSFFEQVARKNINYKSFSYCLPADETVRGYMVLGDYVREDVEIYTPLFQSTWTPTYSLRLVSLVANGHIIRVSSSVSEMMVDSGALFTFLPGDTFRSLDETMTPAVETALAPLNYGYKRSYQQKQICFESYDYRMGKTGRHPIFSSWSILPSVEMVFEGADALSIPAKNIFYNNKKYGLCMYFTTSDAMRFRILANRVTRSFETIFDIQSKKFGFRSAAC